MTLVHRIAHLFRWNGGRVEVWREGQRLMVGFRCSCGRLDGVHDGTEPIEAMMEESGFTEAQVMKECGRRLP